jgi:hypothetical protein
MNTFKQVFYSTPFKSYKSYFLDSDIQEKIIILYDYKNNINKYIKGYMDWYFSDYVRYFNSIPLKNKAYVSNEELKIINS